MANLTITVPEDVLKSARRRALEQGTSVNALLRDYLQQFSNVQPAHAKAAARVLELSRKARAGRGKASWTRDDLHRR
jgi:plasmid stability protein